MGSGLGGDPEDAREVVKTLKYWKRIRLNAPFHADYYIVPIREVNEDDTMFDYILDAVKKSDCSFVIYERTTKVSESRGNLAEIDENK